eukprot:Stramenopile-MAST_4_protein_619
MPKPQAGENVVPDQNEIGVTSLFSLRGKVSVITGGGSGIGAMIAAGYVANGARVYIVSRKDCSPFAAQLSHKYEGECISIQGDLAKPDSLVQVVSKICTREPGGIHILVNNAGTNWSQPFDDYSLEGWDRVYDLNVRSVFHMTQKLAPALERAASNDIPSRVINISSIDAENVTPLPTFAYSSGKAAVIRLTKVLAGHLAVRNICVNAVLPGAFPSRMMRATLREAGDAIALSNPMQRVGGIKDIAGTCIFLASRASSWITGSTVTVDGGALLNIDTRAIRTKL